MLKPEFLFDFRVFLWTFSSMKSLLLCVFSIITFCSTGQNTLKGKVIDSKTKEPLAFAHIGIPKIGMGTTTRDRGELELTVPQNVFEDELTVSFFGQACMKPNPFVLLIAT